jgi:hypothetical protein
MQFAQDGRRATELQYRGDWCKTCGEHGHKKWACPSRPIPNALLNSENPTGRDPPLPFKKRKIDATLKSLDEELASFVAMTGIVLPGVEKKVEDSSAK